MRMKALAVVGALALTALSPLVAEAATGQITGYGGKCVDVAGGSSANGTAVQLYDCNGTGAQSWTATSSGQLINTGSGKCLDATDWSSANGTQLQIWSCTGAANQQWSVPGGSGMAPSAPMAVAPYLYEGWGSPPNPADIMNATGVRWFTLAFLLSNGTCNPQWDGSRPLSGGVDQATVTTIRNAGGDVIPSFGGYSGNKLEQSCTSASALAGAYQQVINTYGFKAIDIDIEADAYSDATVQQRTVDALKTIRAGNPSVKIFVTIGSGQSGPDTSLINRAASAGFAPDSWTIMPFDFGGAGQNMGTLTVQAAEGLKNALKTAYGYSDDTAYQHSGISSMNGVTDQQETVTLTDFTTIRDYAAAHHLSRLTFWSANRDRPCTSGGADSCSGVSQQNWDYTRIFAGYTG
jgi:hypothetical protein